VVAPGWGDAVQAAKAGILEVADVYVVNKSDRDGVNDAVRDLNLMLRTGEHGDWLPPVVRTSTVSGEGMGELWESVVKHRTHLESTGRLEARRRARLLAEVQNMVGARLRARTAAALESEEGRDLADALAAGETDPYGAASTLLGRLEGAVP
jgi:GTPase